mmetsp:Transcript_11058/g.24813  ORF Transcript_11058/g.24813 Transcript_11058/m.24813 type:complete len:342 (-) Transcript_11058:74-1099(-)
MGNCCTTAESAKNEEAISQLKAEKDDSDAETEDDDDDYVEDLPPPAAYLKKGPRSSVSAEAYGDWNKKTTTYTPPFYQKPPETEQRLKAALAKSFMFNSLDEKDLKAVIGAFRQVDKNPGDIVIQQGDTDAKELFMLEKGELHVFKKFSQSETGDGKRVFQYDSAGDVFGELALLYNCPRAASIRAASKCILWSIDRETFSHLVKDAASRKRNKYENFLKSVDILGSLDSFEIGQMADALQARTFKKNEKVITQGDVGNEFYILEEGAACAVKDGARVKEYKEKEYFGELALIRSQPRAADVVIDSATAKVLCIDRKSFKRLLGPLDKILEQRAASYTGAK